MNIGMFPMSGIRVCDAELLRLGLTLPGFVERSKTIASLPSLGLLTLAGMFDINFKPTHMSGQELHEGFKKLVVDLYSEEFTNWRRSRFKHTVREHRHRKGILEPDTTARECPFGG